MGRITLISDPKITNIPICESGQKLADISKFPCIHTTNKRENSNPSFKQIRTEVAERLIIAQGNLPSGFNLCLEEGLRTIGIQKIIYEKYYTLLRKNLRDLSEKQILEHVCRYVAKPEGVPPHSTGGAVDVTLVSDGDIEYNLGSNSDETPLENGTRNFTHCRIIDSDAKNNRLLLMNAMKSAGFINYPAEWWHWSFGDQYWAYRSSRKYAIYGIALPI